MRPWFEAGDGQRVELEWRRLRPESEVGAFVSLPPPKDVARQLGEAYGRGSRGAGFDRIEVEVSPVLSGVEGSPLEAGSMAVNVSAAWRADQVAELEAEAVAILAAFDHPADHMERAIAWAWVGSDLMWAAAPARTGFVVGLARPWVRLLSPSVPDRVPRSGSWSTAAKAPAFAEAWPAFGAFAWAREVYAGVRTLRYARERLEGPTEDRPTALVEAAWVAGFQLAAFLTEHRIRSVHSKLLTRGERDRGVRVKGLKKTQAALAARYQKRRGLVQAHALELLDGPPTNGSKKWSRASVASAIHLSWKGSKPVPTVRTIERDLKAAGLPQ